MLSVRVVQFVLLSADFHRNIHFLCIYYIICIFMRMLRFVSGGHAEIDTICTYMNWLCITLNTNDVCLVCVRMFMYTCVHVWSSQLGIGLNDLVFVESCIVTI